MKSILIIGAGFLQSFIIQKAKKLGYHTIAIDGNPNAIGFALADEYENIDIVNQQACLTYAKSKSIDGVMTAATDYGVLSAALISQEMKLPGLNYEAAKLIKNKYMVRKALDQENEDNRVNTFEINNIQQLSLIRDSIIYPVMVKPCDGSGSKAATRVNDSMDLDRAILYAIQMSLVGKALIEPFITGKEYGVESFVYNNKIHIMGIMNKYMTTPPDYAELGHSVPNDLPKSIEKNLRGIVSKAIRNLGINFGAVNMDVLISQSGNISIIDIGARMGGNLIGSHIIPLGTGIDYPGNLVRAAVADPIDINPINEKDCIATRLLALKPGKVVKLPDFQKISQELNVDILHHLHIGSIIREYHNNLDGCGYIVAKGCNVEEAENRAEKAKQLIDRVIVRAF